MRDVITKPIENIRPFDALEREHSATALQWVASGAPLWWFALDRLPLDRAEPHLERFIRKLRALSVP